MIAFAIRVGVLVEHEVTAVEIAQVGPPESEMILKGELKGPRPIELVDRCNVPNAGLGIRKHVWLSVAPSPQLLPTGLYWFVTTPLPACTKKFG